MNHEGKHNELKELKKLQKSVMEDDVYEKLCKEWEESDCKSVSPKMKT